jgi:hypothetical protein
MATKKRTFTEQHAWEIYNMGLTDGFERACLIVKNEGKVEPEMLNTPRRRGMLDARAKDIRALPERDEKAASKNAQKSLQDAMEFEKARH